jgi:hypothetical protein
MAERMVRRILIYTHRWLGICGCLLFVSWFASGIVMMYTRMPGLSASERLARLEPLDLSRARVSLGDLAGAEIERVRITMLAGRPLYRVVTGAAGQRLLYGDDGGAPGRISAEQARAIAGRFAPEHASTLRYESRLTDPDQWTLSGEARRAMPLHVIALGDAARTELYISEATAEVVLKTDARGRRWAYAGAIPHWIYFTPLRRHARLWAQTIIWLSLAGCVLCLSGIGWGVWRFSIFSKYRIKREYSRSPYAGLMRWHHYAGLIFGAAASTWIFSGLLSMDPWEWHPPTEPSSLQRTAVAGGPLRSADLTAARVAAGARQLAERTAAPLKELEIFQFRGERFLASGSQAVSLDAPGRGVFASFGADLMLAAAHAAMPGVPIRDVAWLHEYDSYYYGRMGTLPLPVLRVRYDDAQRTWLYLDPGRGSIVRKEERLTRVNRWLYHGLHSLDFPFLYNRRPLWDLVVIGLSGGGLVVSAAPMAAAARRLRRHWRRLRRSGDLVTWRSGD